MLKGNMTVEMESMYAEEGAREALLFMQNFKNGADGTWMVLRTSSERGPMVLTGHCNVPTAGYQLSGRKRWIAEDGK